MNIDYYIKLNKRKFQFVNAYKHTSRGDLQKINLFDLNQNEFDIIQGVSINIFVKVRIK